MRAKKMVDPDHDGDYHPKSMIKGLSSKEGGGMSSKKMKMKKKGLKANLGSLFKR